MISAGNRNPTYDAAVATIHDHPSSPDRRVDGAMTPHYPTGHAAKTSHSTWPPSSSPPAGGGKPPSNPSASPRDGAPPPTPTPWPPCKTSATSALRWAE